MKKTTFTIILGLALVLMTSPSSYAMSELVSLSVNPEWPVTVTPGTVVLYNVTTVGRAGAGLLEVTFSSAGLPEAMTVTFSPPVLRFTGNAATEKVSVMTITCPAVMPTEIYPFTVTATAQRESLTITNQVVLPPSGGLQSVTLGVVRLSETNLELRGKGLSGQTYQIETTTDLAHPDWTPIGTTTADGNGRFMFPITVDKNTPQRFFRAVSL